MVRLGMRFDLRAPSFGAPRAALYDACLDMAAWADRNGFELIRMSEHHAADDGYLPSPLVLGAAIAARTERARLRISALLLALHDPVRVAEDIAVLDNISGGRVEAIVGAGYRRREFDMFGIDMADRVHRVESGIAALRALWSRDDVTVDGRVARVRPRPLQEPNPPIFLGGSTPKAARRAARIADGFVPTDPALYATYREECARLGKEPGPDGAITGPSFVHVTDDPERAWAQIEPHALHETNSYAAWLSDDGTPGPFVDSTPASIRSNPAYRVLTPEECIRHVRDAAIELLVLHPLMGGLDPGLAWSSLELFETAVLPELTAPATPTG